MDLATCLSFRDEIKDRFAAIEKYRKEQRSLDIPALKSLGDYCKQIRPQFVIGTKFYNVGREIEAVAVATKRAIKETDTSEVHRALAHMDAVIDAYRTMRPRSRTRAEAA